MENFIVIGILVLIIGGAAFYVYRAKKSGKRCIGCPSGGTCDGACQSCFDAQKAKENNKK